MVKVRVKVRVMVKVRVKVRAVVKVRVKVRVTVAESLVKSPQRDLASFEKALNSESQTFYLLLYLQSK